MADAAAQAAADNPHMNAAPAIVPGRRIHIDGDMIAYWAGGNDETTVDVSRQVAANKIEAMRMQAGAESVVLHLTAASSSKGDRYLIATVKPYQGQRSSSRKPKNWGYLRDWMENYKGDAFKVKLWGTREADDGLALMTVLEQEPVISTKDKDMRMLTGCWHMDWDTMAMHFVPVGTFDVVVNEKQYGHKWFWLQTLHGDTADHIPGLPFYIDPNDKPKQCGEKTAAKLLEGVIDNGMAFSVVRTLYEGYYGNEWAARLLEQALLLWLRTDKHAVLDNVFTILPRHSALMDAMDKINLRIKETYAEAHRLSGQSPTRTDAL